MATSMQSADNTPIKLAHTQEPNEVTEQFNLHQPKFMALGTAEDFTALSDQLISIDVQSLLDSLGEDSSFEVTLPMTGMADFLSNPIAQGMPQQFPSVIALNGFGADSSGSEGFPRPHYVMVTDIVGNEYEVLVDANGQIEIPEQGMGLFSMLSSITLIYSVEQVLEGSGFSSLQEAGAEPGMVYLLAPPGTESQFSPTLRVSHLNEQWQREIDVEQKVSVEVHDTQTSDSSGMKVQADLLEQDGGSLVHLELLGTPDLHHQPLKLQMMFQNQGTEFELLEFSAQQTLGQSLGWNQVDGVTFEKWIGLSDYAKLALVRDVYSEMDFTRSLLTGDDFGVSHQNNFNDFGLRPEAIGPFYDILVDGVIHNKIPSQDFFSHVPVENLVDLDLSYAELSAGDQQVVDQITEQFQAHDFSMLDQLFLSEQDGWMDEIYLRSDQLLDALPDLTLNVLWDQAQSSTLIDHQELSFPDMDMFSSSADAFSLNAPDSSISSLQAGTFGENLELAPGHQATTIHYQDVVDVSTTGDVISGFDFAHDKIDLTGLLENLPGASKDNVQLSTQGDELHIQVTDQAGELHPIATIVGLPPDLHGDDLAQIIVTDT